LVDAFKIKTGLKTEVCMFFNERTPVCVFTTNGTIVQTLGSRIATDWETKRELCINIHDEVFLFKAKPKVSVIIIDGCSSIAEVRSSVRVHDFAHNEVSIDALWIGEDVDWL
jgi:hypothetical protein